MYLHCRLPIGSTFTMNGQGKKIAIDGFSLDQAYSAMAMWAMIASPLMIGADMRDIAPEFRAVWLNKELIRVNQVSFYLPEYSSSLEQQLTCTCTCTCDSAVPGPHTPFALLNFLDNRTVVAMVLIVILMLLLLMCVLHPGSSRLVRDPSRESCCC